MGNGTFFSRSKWDKNFHKFSVERARDMRSSPSNIEGTAVFKSRDIIERSSSTHISREFGRRNLP